ncbi:MAG: glucose-6-phosphate isomerase [Lysobacteraceae bacterium]
MKGPQLLDRLIPHAIRLADQRIADLVTDPRRLAVSSLRVGPLYANFARQRLDADAVAALLELAQERGVQNAIADLFDGVPVNRSENRPALHTALRGCFSEREGARAAHQLAQATRERMGKLISELAASNVTDIVNVGIGGSDLGPRLALEALRDHDTGRFRIHFLSNADGNAAAYVLRQLDPQRTAAVIVSKSFGTQETALNGRALLQFLGSGERLYAVSAKPELAQQQFGIDPVRVLPMWDWVGGRYSLWSSVGFVIAAAVGMGNFERLLQGAALMDEHVRHAPLRGNLAIRHGLAAVWNRNAFSYDSHAVLAYDDRLARLPAYLQQLMMESLGKSVRQDGTPVEVGTGPVIWGGAGTDVQHSFCQSLHQGTDAVPLDLVGVVRAPNAVSEQRAPLFSNLLAQAEAFANGASNSDPHKVYPGNRPSTLLLLDELTPEAFGALLALYEHSVFVQATIWGINPFDQWGVELGKRIAVSLQPAVEGANPPESVVDPVTRMLLEEIRARS